jgi:hypothetical protein
MGGDHPIAWYHDYDGGRAFYTAGGHGAEAYSEPDFRSHLLGGLIYAVGPGSDPPGPPSPPSDASVLLQGDRFKVEATWRRAGGPATAAHLVRLTTDTAYLWFFQRSNVEAVVKVLKGCGTNNRYWVFAGGLTDLRVDLTVTDTRRGTVQRYTNPQGRPFVPIQDTGAFATCP